MKRKSKKKKLINKKTLYYKSIIVLVVLFVDIILLLNPNIRNYFENLINQNTYEVNNVVSYDLNSIPEYTESPYVILNNNIPNFTEQDYTTESFERYSKLDSLGRCGVTFANICREIMPKEGEKRGDISSVKPTGWRQKKYNGEFLYNRCHLIGYQLSSEDANEQNLITGTRYFNVTGMLPFENQVAEYIKNQRKDENKHVLYRVTPYFKNNELLARRCTNGSFFD